MALSLLILDCVNNFVSPFVSQVAMNHEQGVDNSRHPESQGQKNTYDSLEGFAAQKYCHRRQQNC